jgi:dihydrofolate reductase
VKASVFIATSVDGFIARTNGDLDWLPAGGGEEHGYDAFIASVDALVIGRKTFETVLTFGAGPSGGTPVYVLSTGAHWPPLPSGLWWSGWQAPAEIVSQLTARGVRHAYVDGGITIQRFLQAGLIQRLTISGCAVLLGEGIPLFGVTGRDDDPHPSRRASTPAASSRASIRSQCSPEDPRRITRLLAGLRAHGTDAARGWRSRIRFPPRPWAAASRSVGDWHPVHPATAGGSRYAGRQVDVTIDYLDWQFDVVFERNGLGADYLFLDRELFGHRSGLHGNMLPPEKLPKVVAAVARDIRRLAQAPREKPRLP